MDLGRMKIAVDDSDIDKAAAKLDNLGEKANKSGAKTKTLSAALKSMAGIDGPIGAIAGSLEEVAGKAGAASSSIASLSSVMGTTAASALVLGPALIAVAGGMGIVAALRFTSQLDDIGDLATRLGYSTSQLALLKQQLESAGTSVETFVGAQQRVANALAKSDDEGAKAAEALKTLGINVNANTQPTEVLSKLTEEYGEKLKTGKASVDEMAALQLVLGRNYREAMQAAEEAGKATQRYNEFMDLGIGLSNAGSEAAGDYETAQNNLSYVFQVVGSQLVAEIIPAFTGLIKALVDSYKSGGTVAAVFDLIKLSANIVMVPIRELIKLFITFDFMVTSVGKGIGALFAAIATRSTAPFAQLKLDIADLSKTAEENIKKVGWWGTDDKGVAQPTTPGVVAPSKNTADPKKPKADKSHGTSVDLSYMSMNGITDRSVVENFTRQMAERDAKVLEDYSRKLEQLVSDTPIKKTEQLQNNLAFLDQAFFDGKINADLYEQAVAGLTGKMKDAKPAVEDLTFAQRIANTAFKGLEDSIANLASTGKFSFKSFIASILSDITRLITQMYVIIPLMNALKASMNGGSFWTSLSGAFGGSSTGGTSTIAGGSGIKLATGTNYVPYDGMKAVLHRGEAVVPAAYNPAAGGSGSGGPMTITVGDIYVQGGQTNAETGAVIKKVIESIPSMADARIKNATMPGGILYK